MYTVLVSHCTTCNISFLKSFRCMLSTSCFILHVTALNSNICCSYDLKMIMTLNVMRKGKYSPPNLFLPKSLVGEFKT